MDGAVILLTHEGRSDDHVQFGRCLWAFGFGFQRVGEVMEEHLGPSWW